METMGTKGNGRALATVLDCLCANGEAPASNGEVIPCQAAEGQGSADGVETRKPSPNSNASHERPTPAVLQGEDIVRHSEETPRVSLNSSRNSCLYLAVKMYAAKKNILVKNAGRAAGSL